jgi:hypothetical protein
MWLYTINNVIMQISTKDAILNKRIIQISNNLYKITHNIPFKRHKFLIFTRIWKEKATQQKHPYKSNKILLIISIQLQLYYFIHIDIINIYIQIET